MALSLAREEDLELVPALVEDDGVTDPWAAVAARAGEALVERAVLLGLPVAWLPADGPMDRPAAVTRELPSGAPRGGAADLAVAPPAGVARQRLPVSGPPRGAAGVRVVELSSLWAGPLCGSLLLAHGAEVIKVESSRRVDGARLGPPAFFDLLNGGKASVALDLTSDAGRRDLFRLLRSADVVIEGSRPRAIEQLGIDRRTVGAPVWLSLTGHGREGGARSRVAFGDDAAVAGGLVVWDDAGPCFCADAVADPLSGMVAAAAVLDALASGGRWLLDVAMAGVAAVHAGPTLPVPPGVDAAPPRARRAAAPARPLGADTAAVLATLPS
jgi:crotonobetainyl-CoA:carnitine CoA-transferase CaiB-like acyl-CoA transferase